MGKPRSNILAGFQLALIVASWTVCGVCGCDAGPEIRDFKGDGQVAIWVLPAGGGGEAGRMNLDARPRPPGEIVAFSRRVDAMHDSKRNLLYVSTADGKVVRMDMNTGVGVGEWDLGGTLGGLDLSPDQDTLIVADTSSSTVIREPSVHRIDLVNDSTHTIALLGAEGGEGALSVAFLDDTRVLVSAAGTINMVTLDDEQSRIVHQVRGTVVLARDSSHSIIAYAAVGDGEGSFGRYRVADDTFADTRVGGAISAFAVDHVNERYALATATKLLLLDARFANAGFVYGSGRPAGVAFASDGKYVCASLQHTERPSANFALVAYDTTSLKPRAQLEATEVLLFSAADLNTQGALEASDDGRWLFADAGERLYAIAIAP